MGSTEVSLFTFTSLASFGAVLALLAVSYLSCRLLPASSTQRQKFTFSWLAFDALIHFSFEGSFLALSFPPPATVLTAAPSAFKTLWLEYAVADTRWGVADPTVVALELLTVLGAGPLCCWIMWKMWKGDRGVHYWLVVLSTAEIYGGWMTFAPEWLVGSPSLNQAESWIHLWLHLFLMNMIWVVIPAWIMWDSFGYITQALRDPAGYAVMIKAEELMTVDIIFVFTERGYLCVAGRHWHTHNVPDGLHTVVANREHHVLWAATGPDGSYAVKYHDKSRGENRIATGGSAHDNGLRDALVAGYGHSFTLGGDPSHFFARGAHGARNHIPRPIHDTFDSRGVPHLISLGHGGSGVAVWNDGHVKTWHIHDGLARVLHERPAPVKFIHLSPFHKRHYFIQFYDGSTAYCVPHGHHEAFTRHIDHKAGTPHHSHHPHNRASHALTRSGTFFKHEAAGFSTELLHAFEGNLSGAIAVSLVGSIACTIM